MNGKKFALCAKIAGVPLASGWGYVGDGLNLCGLLVHTVDEADRIAAIAGVMFGAVVKVSLDTSGLWCAYAPWVA